MYPTAIVSRFTLTDDIPFTYRSVFSLVRNFDPEYKLVAAGWSKLADKSQFFLGVLDFKAGQAIFQKFGMNSAPSVLFFPPTDSDQSKHERYDFSRKYVFFFSLMGGVRVRVRGESDTLQHRDMHHGRSGGGKSFAWPSNISFPLVQLCVVGFKQSHSQLGSTAKQESI